VTCGRSSVSSSNARLSSWRSGMSSTARTVEYPPRACRARGSSRRRWRPGMAQLRHDVTSRGLNGIPKPGLVRSGSGEGPSRNGCRAPRDPPRSHVDELWSRLAAMRFVETYSSPVVTLVHTTARPPTGEVRPGRASGAPTKGPVRLPASPAALHVTLRAPHGPLLHIACFRGGRR